MKASEHIFESDVKNDRIDIYKDPTVKIKDMSKKDIFGDTLHLQLEGNCIDNSVSNGIRQTILKKIPIYAFHRKNIHVENDKSYNMYNNDMLFNQIETLPIYDIPNYFDLENPEIFLPDHISKDIFGTFKDPMVLDNEEEPDRKKKKSSESIGGEKKLFRIEFTLNVKNATNTEKYVSTHDAVLRIDGKKVDSYLKHDPVDIIVLKELKEEVSMRAEELSLRAEANLGISQDHAMYDATTNVVSKEIESNKWEIIYDTIGQLDKYIIFQKACFIIQKKLKNLHSFVKKTYTAELDPKKYVEIRLHGEDHMLGNLLGTALQKCTLITDAGYEKPHPLKDLVIIKFLIASKTDITPIQVFCDTVKYLIKVHETIEQNLPKRK